VRPLRSRSRIKMLFGALATMNRALHAGSEIRTNYGQLDAALEGVLQLAGHDYLICVVSDFAGASERTQRLLRQLSAHNDVVAAMVFDPAFDLLRQRDAGHRALVVSEGRLQVELRIEQERVRAPLSSLFSVRTAQVAELLRSSGVPLMALSTAEPTVGQVRRLFGERARPSVGSGL